MDSDRRRQISQIHQAALERPPAERLAFLEHVCADDAELRSEVALLLNGPAASGIATANRPLHAAPGSGPHLQPGAMLGAYRIERQLGAGGMGAVFLAVDTTLHRRVALKVLTSSAGDESARSRLLREARNAAALNHPDICTIHEVGDAGGIAFIAMEYVEGESLRERIGRGPMPIDAVLRIGRAVADALGYAHDNGVVHRDLKAANVIVLPSDRVKIVDFGLARRGDALIAEATTMASLVPEGAMAGTPYAMAPEQIRGETADARSDVWALGVLLWEMVNGAPPFVASTVPELFAKILTLDRLEWPAKAPIALRAVVERCLRKNPADRFPNGRDAHRAIEGVRSGPASLWSAWRYRLRRRRWTAATAALIVLALGAGVVFRGAIDRLAGIFRGQTIRLAVLPFENLTGDPAQQYLSDGLTDELITQLARLHPARLQVIAKTSSMQFRNRGATLDEIGRQLHVDYVLEGSARRDRDRVRISAMLVQVSDQAQKWSGSFERELSGILSLESDVAFGVARSLALSLLPVEQARLAGPPAVNPEAYEAYLKGLVLRDGVARAPPTPTIPACRTSMWPVSGMRFAAPTARRTSCAA